MSKSITISSKKGLGFISTLTLIFIIMKLTGFISWSWWLVFLPILLLSSITGLLFIVTFIFFVIAISNDN